MPMHASTRVIIGLGWPKAVRNGCSTSSKIELYEEKKATHLIPTVDIQWGYEGEEGLKVFCASTGSRQVKELASLKWKF